MQKNKIINSNSLINDNLDFRGIILVDGKSCYGLENKYKKKEKIFDFSSCTASQATNIELEDLHKTFNSIKSNEEILNDFDLIDPAGFNFIPLSSGSDSDLLVADIMRKNFKKFSILTIGIEESGRLCSNFLNMSLDYIQIGLKNHYVQDKLISLKESFDSKLSNYHNIAITKAFLDKDFKIELSREIKNFVEENLKTSEVILIRFNVAAKTGILLPELDFLAGLKDKFKNRILIYADACQMRNLQDIKKFSEKLSFLSISFSKFYQVPPFAGALFINKNIEKNGLYTERLVNPFWTNRGSQNILKISGNFKNIIPENCGSASRFLLGMNRLDKNKNEIDLFQKAKVLREEIMKITTGKEIRSISLIEPIALCKTSPTIFSFSLKNLNSKTTRLFYERIKNLKVDNKNVLVGQPVIASYKFNIAFRISLGFRSCDETLDDLVNQTKAVLLAIDDL